MPIDAVEKRRCVAYNMPTPDGVISIFDRRHIAGNYRGMPIPVALSGSMTPTGSLSVLATYKMALDGSMTPTGGLSTKQFLSLGGSMTPVGSLTPVATWVISIGGSMTPSGGITSINNPDWIPIDDRLRWMGEWIATYVYTVGDVVMYKTAEGNYHGWLSRTTHNVGNIPTTAYAHWARIVQAKWKR